MRAHPREIVLGIAFSVVTYVLITFIVLSSDPLSNALGMKSPGWINGMLVVEVVRMVLVGVLTLGMIRQRHGLEDRQVGVVNAGLVGLGTWVVLTGISVAVSMLDSTLPFRWSEVIGTLVIWLGGALLAVFFVTPGEATRVRNIYLDRLDREAMD